MKSIEIKGFVREATGKTNTNSVRKHGNVPCVLYGGNEIIHFTSSEIGFKDLVYTASAHTVILDLGDKKKNAILQDIQFHPVSDKILHADFYELHDDKPVTMDIPVELVVRSIVFSGWATGVYTQDVMLLIFGPILDMTYTLLDRDGIDYVPLAKRAEDTRLSEAMEKLSEYEGMLEDPVEEEETEEVPETGLMGRRE